MTKSELKQKLLSHLIWNKVNNKTENVKSLFIHIHSILLFFVCLISGLLYFILIKIIHFIFRLAGFVLIANLPFFVVLFQISLLIRWLLYLFQILPFIQRRLLEYDAAVWLRENKKLVCHVDILLANTELKLKWMHP